MPPPVGSFFWISISPFPVPTEHFLRIRQKNTPPNDDYQASSHMSSHDQEIDQAIDWAEPITGKPWAAYFRVHFSRPGRLSWTIPRIVAIAGADTFVRTLAEVGQAFNKRHSTVKTIWRPSGMPGRPGHYRLAEILLWLYRRDAKNAGLLDPHDVKGEALEILAEQVADQKRQSVPTNGKKRKRAKA